MAILTILGTDKTDVTGPQDASKAILVIYGMSPTTLMNQ